MPNHKVKAVVKTGNIQDASIGIETMKRTINFLLVLLMASVNSVFAQSLVGSPIDPDPDGVARPSDDELACAPKNRHMVTMSVPGDPSMKRGCSLAFDFNKETGKVEQLRLLRSSGKPNVDFDCICAVLGSAPFEANERGDHTNIRYTFGGRDLSAATEGIRAINRVQRENLNASISKLGIHTEDYFLCNVIPVSIAFRYPGLFKDSELCDGKNLRQIPKRFFASNNEPTFQMIVANQRFRAFFDRWTDFVSKNKKPTKDEIEKFRDGVGSEFKDMFLAPPASISKR